MSIKINFEEVRMTRGVSFDLYDYIEEVFSEMQENANIDNTSIMEQLNYANQCGSYSCNAYETQERLNNLYDEVADFISEYENETGVNLARLYFESIESFEIYFLYDLYYKFIEDYDNEDEEDEEE